MQVIQVRQMQDVPSDVNAAGGISSGTEITVSESALAEHTGRTTPAVTVMPTTMIYLVMARQAIGRNHWPARAFYTKEAAEAFTSTKNLAYDGMFYTVSPLTLASLS